MLKRFRYVKSPGTGGIFREALVPDLSPGLELHKAAWEEEQTACRLKEGILNGGGADVKKG